DRRHRHASLPSRRPILQNTPWLLSSSNRKADLIDVPVAAAQLPNVEKLEFLCRSQFKWSLAGFIKDPPGVRRSGQVCRARVSQTTCHRDVSAGEVRRARSRFLPLLIFRVFQQNTPRTDVEVKANKRTFNRAAEVDPLRISNNVWPERYDEPRP